MSYEKLAERSAALMANYPEVKTPEDEAWEGSPFDWFRKKASSTKGKIGRDLALSIFESAGFGVLRKGVAFEIRGKTIRVKTSLIWGAGEFKFEQFRDSDYDFVLCLGLYPNKSYAWFIPKEELIDNGIMQEREGLTGQHGGKEDADDFWLAVNVSSVPDWLTPYGGTTDQVLSAIINRL
jgi:hypothetical protein